MPSESFHRSSWESRTCYPSRATNQETLKKSWNRSTAPKNEKEVIETRSMRPHYFYFPNNVHEPLENLLVTHVGHILISKEILSQKITGTLFLIHCQHNIVSAFHFSLTLDRLYGSWNQFPFPWEFSTVSWVLILGPYLSSLESLGTLIFGSG